MQKIKCEECEWIGSTEDVLEAQSPFNDKLTIYGCPDCKEIEKFITICDVDDCKEDYYRGLLVKDKGYMFLCSKHYREMK